MIDIGRTIELVTGALFERESTWRAYLPDAGDWRKTAFLLTGPLIIASAVIAYLVGLLAGNGMFRPTILSTVATIIMGAIAMGALSFIVSALSGTFGGKRDFSLALAAATLAFVPGYVGQALVWLPWIGWLLGIGLGIFSLVQLWQIIPMYLDVPDSKRVMHYIVSIVATIIVMMIVSRIFSPMMPGPQFNADNNSTGMFGDINRQAALVAEVEKDSYTPPEDGKLTERQVRDFVAVMAVVDERMSEAIAEMAELTARAEEDGEVSMKEFGTMMRGVTEAGGIATVEMETVKAAGGNWAEHKWVQETLWTARFQKQGSEAIEHNFALFEEYEDQLVNDTGR